MKSITLFVLGCALGILIAPSTAHTPCNDYQPPKQCKYVQVVNPYTGNLETEYVCE